MAAGEIHRNTGALNRAAEGIMPVIEGNIISYETRGLKEKKYGYDIDRYFGTYSRRRTAHLASQ